jgi:hypothetical protein
MPSGFPALDAEVSSGSDQFALQITIADPIWAGEGAKIKHGGYDNRLLMEGLNRQGVVHGSGGFRRDGDKIISDEPVKNGSDGADACRRGIVAALARKSKPDVHPAARLLIYTRAYTMQVVDEGYANVVAEAVREFETSRGGQAIPFSTLYFVDEREFVEQPFRVSCNLLSSNGDGLQVMNRNDELQHDTISVAVSSPILFHCWRHEDKIAARLILESICRKGLLLTTNSKTLDSFAIDRGSGVVPMEVMQHARVCFTDIPIGLLATHGQRYGKYGVGFRRETVIDWGGLPAWYLPNYWSDKTLKCVGPVLVNSLHAGIDAVRNLQALAREFAAKGIPLTVVNTLGPALQADQLVNEMETVHRAMFAVLSFVKEMSPRTSEDHSYLFEREWRIVEGFGLAGQPPAFRELTEDEKQVLRSKNSRWGARRESQDVNITARYGAAPVIDSFRYFNGLSGKPSVAELIDTFLVPDEAEAQWASNFIAENKVLFGDVAPTITLFPAEDA